MKTVLESSRARLSSVDKVHCKLKPHELTTFIISKASYVPSNFKEIPLQQHSIELKQCFHYGFSS